MFTPEHQRDLHRLTHFEPELAARSWLLMEEVGELVGLGLIGPNRSRSELLRARVLVRACIMAVDAAITTWIEGGMREDLATVLDEAAEHLRRGFARPAHR